MNKKLENLGYRLDANRELFKILKELDSKLTNKEYAHYATNWKQ